MQQIPCCETVDFPFTTMEELISLKRPPLHQKVQRAQSQYTQLDHSFEELYVVLKDGRREKDKNPNRN